MKTKKHVLVLFTKYPEPGVTKTRLMEENGGELTGEEASELYKAMLLDVASVGFHALNRCRRELNSNENYDFFLSSTPARDMLKVQELFRSEFPSEKIHYMVDHGRNFDEHFNDCYRQLFERGYHSVVCVGGDLPAMTPDMLMRAFQKLAYLEKGSDRGALVMAPCQASGVSLVGITGDAPMDFTGVFYNPEGISALDAITAIAAQKGVPTALLETLSDVDYIEDLGHMISVLNAMSYCSRFQPEIKIPERTLTFIQQVGLETVTPPNESFDPRSDIDDTYRDRRDKM